MLTGRMKEHHKEHHKEHELSTSKERGEHEQGERGARARREGSLEEAVDVHVRNSGGGVVMAG